MRLLNTLLLSGFLFGIPSLFSQTLPESMWLSPDDHILRMGKQKPTGLYDSATIRTIYLDFSQPDYWQLLTQNYATKIDIPATMTVDGVVYDSVGVRFKGQTSYFQIQNSQKKSFNLSLDHFLGNQTLMGYKTLNLNNCFQDESFMREVFYLHQIRQHIPVAKANYVQLYLNGQNWGLYPNVQQLNKDFLEEWFLSNDGANWRADRPDGQTTPGGPGGPGWGDGTAALNYLGADTALYKQYYTLKSSDVDNPWDYLVHTAEVLNTTPAADLPAALPEVLDIDRTLWFLACEIAFSDDDSYVFKGKMDYYVYYEPETGRMTPLEYDGNSVMGPNNVNWGPFYNQTKVNYPLLNKILAVPMWRQRYLAHLRTILETSLDVSSCNQIIDNYKVQIDALVQADPKKLYTYTQFNTEIPILKTFIQNRRNALLANAEVNRTAPSIADVSWQNAAGTTWAAPYPGETVSVRATVTSTNGIHHVTLFVSGGLVGNFTPYPMYDDGQHNDGAANDGVFGGTVPAFDAGQWVRFYIEAGANDAAVTVRYFPAGAEHDVFAYQVNLSPANNVPVVINELLASNDTGATDEVGQHEDWIELYNTGSNPVDLSGFYLTDNPDNLDKWTFPANTILPGNSYLIVWADEDGSQGPLHANFKLSASGESLHLLTADLNLVDSVVFGPQTTDVAYARVPNGTGPFVAQAPTFGAHNNPAVDTGEPAAGKALSLRLAPNPAHDRTTLYIAGPATGEPIRIRDLRGVLVGELTAGNEAVSIPLQQYPAGVYTVQYGRQIAKLIVLH